MTSYPIGDALRKRCAPHTNITADQVAHAIGCAKYTIHRWIRGERKPFAEDVGALDQFFRSQGDERFLVDCYRIPLAAPAPASLAVWFLDGQSFPAPSGHAEFIRRRMGLSPHVSGDLRASACRNRGWVALQQSPIGTVNIWHHTKVQSEAAKAVRDWLILNADKISSVLRTVEIDGRFGEVAHENATSAALALDKLTLPPRRSAPWKVERKPLDTASPKMGKVLSAWTASPDHVIDAAFGMGVMDRGSILGIDGSRVTSQFLGGASRLPRNKIVGKPLLGRDFPDYDAMVFKHATDALEGPTLHEIEASAYEMRMNYRRLFVPAGNGQVLGVVELLGAAA
jgi:hypothetical protein